MLVFGVLSSLRLGSGGHLTQVNRVVVYVNCLARNLTGKLASVFTLALSEAAWRESALTGPRPRACVPNTLPPQPPEEPSRLFRDGRVVELVLRKHF